MAFGVTGSNPHDDPASGPALLLEEAPELPLEPLLEEALALLLEEAPELLFDEALELPLEEAPALLLEEALELPLERAIELLLEAAPEPLEPLSKPPDGETELAAELLEPASDPGAVLAPLLAVAAGPGPEADADDPALPPVADELLLHATASVPATSVTRAQRARRAEASHDGWRSDTIQGLPGHGRRRPHPPERLTRSAKCAARALELARVNAKLGLRS